MVVPFKAAEHTTITVQSIRIGDTLTIPNGIITLPELITYTRPLYTAEAGNRGVEGAVTIEAKFENDGNFKVLRIVRGLGSGLDEKAIAAFRTWRFTPATLNGTRVGVIARVDVEFYIREAASTEVVLPFKAADDVQAGKVRIVYEGLVSYNEHRLGPADRRRMAILAQDSSGCASGDRSRTTGTHCLGMVGR